jgi:Rrf2 family transcriptional regulator, cysteine metabolism repressor
MRISTRTRYGVRFLLELAESHGKGPLFLKDIAKSQEISEKYLSQIVIELKSAGIITGLRGAHGGYVLSREPEQITLREVVAVLEGDLKLVECTRNGTACGRGPECITQDIWIKLADVMAEMLEGITLSDLAAKRRDKMRKPEMYYI